MGASSLFTKLAMFSVFFVAIHASSSAHNKHENHKLRFNKKGEFKILQVSDMHYCNGEITPCLDVLPSQRLACSDLNTTHYLRRYILAENPDLILFSGDNIHGLEVIDWRKSMDEAFKHAIDSGIPWAVVLGNHDASFWTKMTRQEVMEYVVGMKNTLSRLNPSDQPDIYGWGNYNLEVHGAEGSPLHHKSVLNLYFVDSGDYNMDIFNYGYDWIHPSQQIWFTRTSKALQEAYKKGPLPQEKAAPGLAFFHIPLPEYNNISLAQMIGVKQEKVSCSNVNSGFFHTMAQAGDIKAAFVGHGHINDYCGELCGINLCFAGGFGYHGYGKAGWPRRARVINIKLDRKKDGKWGDVKVIETWKRIHDEKLTVIDAQLLWTSGDVGIRSVISDS